ncbi:Protein of unknown function [Sphingomonas gellani]|uniref:DUF3667 domain-containing protein n=1 Tax=Sphingomonas gellani TaxID=1166340 RepID=A0A1H8IXS7_9SPHN|nr:DUF3667 domain-containing protein [Sphingomonas gellani]SEN72488.1 Protein of unknown function [Sphingomonas gellani]
MSADLAAIGEVGDGLMLARTVEPFAGEAAGHHAHRVDGALCLNCGTRLIAEHCHRCGQNGHVHRTVGAIGHEIAHGVFHFEGKMWRTLPMLAWRPGDLTRRYVAGERARFVSPMGIFLFSVFLLFAVVANLPGWHLGDTAWLSDDNIADARIALAKSEKHAADRVGELSRDLAQQRAEREPDTRAIARLTEKLERARTEQANIARTASLLPGAENETHADADNWIQAKWRHARENPQLLLYKVKSSAYKFSWVLIPLSLPFIWLLFPFRRSVGMYDHAVFATYSLSFMSLLLITLAILGALGLSGGWIALAALVIPPLHIYKQLKGAYRLSRVGALWRTCCMLLFAAITCTLFVTMLLYLGTAD